MTVSTGEMETKMLMSHKCIWSTIELLGHVKNSLKYLDDKQSEKNCSITWYIFFEVFGKFCEVFLYYKCRYVANRFKTDSFSELNNVCDFAIDILKFVKVCLSVLLWENPRAQDIIKNISFKAISKMQCYCTKKINTNNHNFLRYRYQIISFTGNRNCSTKWIRNRTG